MTRQQQPQDLPPTVRGLLALQRTAGNQAVVQLLRSVQRVATFTAGAVHQTSNLAQCDVARTPPGRTLPALNGTNLTSSAASRTAIHRPILQSSAHGGGYRARVGTVPTNTGSFDETVLAPPPWRFNTAKSAIGGLYPTLTACTGTGATTFRARGEPSDAHMFAAIRRHEDHHAADHHAVFDATIGDWDQKLTQAMTAGTWFPGTTRTAAIAALCAAMGGTSNAIANAYWNQCRAAGRVYHSTPAGGLIAAGATPPGSAGGCATSWAHFHSPA